MTDQTQAKPQPAAVRWRAVRSALTVRGNEPGLIARIIMLACQSGRRGTGRGAARVPGTWALLGTPVDALPDLGDVQVIIRTPFAGHAPNLVEDQVTFPLSTAMLGVARAAKVRGYSMFGDSFVYVLFEDGTDPYWPVPE